MTVMAMNVLRRYVIASVAIWTFLLTGIGALLWRVAMAPTLPTYAKVLIASLFVGFVAHGLYKFVEAYRRLKENPALIDEDP
jgi:putative Ca2+/H+ antiporter (TMEM165/GDT1 family)